MAQMLYDLHITGKLVEGVSPESAQENFAQLFKTSSDKVARYFTGQPILFKRGIEKPEAMKYKAALHKIGILIAFKTHKVQAETPPPTNQRAATPITPLRPAPTPETSNQVASIQASPEPTAQLNPSSATNTEVATNLSMAPVGSDVLNPEERTVFVEADIDTSDIKMVSTFIEIEPEEKQTPPAPNISHITVAEAGEDLLVDKPEVTPPLTVDIEDFSLAPAGAQLDQLHDDLTPLNPDISGLDIAPPGVDLMEGIVKPPPPAAPDTSHLSVSNK